MKLVTVIPNPKAKMNFSRALRYFSPLPKTARSKNQPGRNITAAMEAKNNI